MRILTDCWILEKVDHLFDNLHVAKYPDARVLRLNCLLMIAIQMNPRQRWQLACSYNKVIAAVTHWRREHQ